MHPVELRGLRGPKDSTEGFIGIVQQKGQYYVIYPKMCQISFNFSGAPNDKSRDLTLVIIDGSLTKLKYSLGL